MLGRTPKSSRADVISIKERQTVKNGFRSFFVPGVTGLKPGPNERWTDFLVKTGDVLYEPSAQLLSLKQLFACRDRRGGA